MSLARLEGGRVGWRHEGEIAASVRVSRAGNDLVIADAQPGGTAAVEALLDALARAATSVDRLVDAHGEVLREVEPSPVNAAPPLTLRRLEEAIRAAWSAETSDRPDEWTSANPAFQQCDVTARVVRDYFGGEILVAGVVLDGKRVDRHAWNRLPSGLELDLSREQFLQGERFEAPEPVEDFVGVDADARYALLSERVRARLAS